MRSANTTQPRSGLSTAGAGRFALLSLLALLAALGVGAALYFGARGHVARGEAAQAPSEPKKELAVEGFEGRVELGTSNVPPPVNVYPAELFSGARFEGTGHLTVYVFAKNGAEFPQRWSLSLEPSKVLIGGEHAVARTFNFEHGEREFTIDDLALGGYDLKAFANGLCVETQQLLFAKPDETNLVAHVEFFPAGYLTGRVVDTSGQPIEGVKMVLVAHPSLARTFATTDPAGAYTFNAVLDGEYELFTDNPDNPLAPGKELIFAAPSLHMPDVVVPLLSEIAILVVDSRGNPVAGAKLEGYGVAGGRVDETTDREGRARARHLRAGEATLIASTSESNQGREKVTLVAGQRAEVTIRLRQ